MTRRQPARHALWSSARAWTLQCLHDLIDAEAGWRLPRRELLERVNELRDQGLRRNRQERQLEHPVVVGIRRDVGAFVRIHAQVVHFWRTQAGERFAPDLDGSGLTLLTEDQFHVLVSHRDKLAVVVEIEE